jgi:PKD repeat protein
MFRTRARWIAAAMAAMLTSACGLEKQTQPSLMGPADTGQSIFMTASPDNLPRDGSSQSVVTLIARDPNNRPLVGQRLVLSVAGGANFLLSQTEVTTNSQGSATFTVSAPPFGSIGNQLVVIATPVGTNADNTNPRSLSIALNPSNTTAPTAAFTVNPATPEIGQQVTFSAASTTDEGGACNGCTFVWDFGGDGTATGMVVTHTFTAGGVFQVTLTATDTAGSSSTIRQNVTVTAISIPTASFSVNPATPIAGQPAVFTANAAASGNHRIVNYNWSWGDGSAETNSSSPTVAHTFNNSGRFFVALTVRDDLGQTMQAFQNLTVSSGLVASFTATQVGPASDHQMHFDASASQSNTGTRIVDYAWDFGDGSTTNGSSPTVDHQYGAAGTYPVTLTITDDRGRKATTSQATAGGGGGGGGVTVQ